MRQPPPYVLLPPGETAQIGPERGSPVHEGVTRFVSPAGSYRYVFYRHGEIVSGLQVMSRDGVHGSIAYVFTLGEHRRERLAAKLLQAARQDFASVEHSTDLSDYGRLWKKGIGDNPPYDWRTHDYKRRPSNMEMEDAEVRILAAGATLPLDYMGAGAQGIIFCGAEGHAWKASRAASDPRYADSRRSSLRDEYEWMLAAGSRQETKRLVPKVYGFHEREAVLERDCVRGELPGWDDDWSDWHDRLAMPGWGAPENGREQWIMSPSGPVMVDGGYAHRRGEVLARHVEAILAGEIPAYGDRLRDMAWSVYVDTQKGRLPQQRGVELLREIRAAGDDGEFSSEDGIAHLLKPRENPPRGITKLRREVGKGRECYPAAEVLYHANGGKGAGLTPMQQVHQGRSHWWVRGPEGQVFDPASAQFSRPVPYAKGKGKGFLTKRPSKRARSLAKRAGVKLNPVPFIEKKGGNLSNWAYITLDLIRSSYTSPSRDHRPAPLPRGADPAVMFTGEFFARMVKAKGELRSKKAETLKRYFERWKTRARDYGLERPDANSHEMPKTGPGSFFALDVLGALDAVWAILGPPHPLEAARVGGFQRGEGREFDLIEAGQERFARLGEPLPFLEELSAGVWDRALRDHSQFWSGGEAPRRQARSQQAARHYSIYPEIQGRLRAAEAFVDPDELVSTLPPILTDEERSQAFRDAALMAGSGTVEDGKGRRRTKRKRLASNEVILKLDELEFQLGLDTLLKNMKTVKGVLTRIRNRTKELSIPREQAIHILYGRTFGGPVPRLKGHKRKAAPEAKRALGKLVKELGEKETGRRLMEISGADSPFTNHRVNLKVLQIRRWLRPWRDADGRKHEPTGILGKSSFNITKLYDQVISQVHVPEAPEDWKAALFFVLDRISQNKLSKRIGMSRGTILNWVRGRTPSVPMQAKLSEVAEEVKGIARDPSKGASPGRQASKPFVPPVSTPPDVSAALRIIHESMGVKSAAEATGVKKQAWNVWATGSLNKGKRRWVPSARWWQIMSLANEIDPSFLLPDPEALKARADLHAAIVYLFMRAGPQRTSDFLGMHPGEIDAIMSSPSLPPPAVFRHIHETASVKYSAAALGKGPRKGSKRTIKEVVPGWRKMLRELSDRYPTINALKTALHDHDYKTGGPVIRRALGDGFVSHKGQRAIAALYEATIGQHA